jgi:putative membrane protein
MTHAEDKLWERGGAEMSIWADANGWPVPPIILIGCLVAEILYFRGWNILVKSAQTKQIRKTVTSLAFAGAHQEKSWFWRGIFFTGTILMLLIASSTPVDVLSSRLFWVHMIQHLLFLVIIAPLFVIAAPSLPLWLGLPRWARRLFKVSVHLKVRRTFYRLGGWLRQPAISCALLIVGTWVWHWPPLYDLALRNSAIHDWCEHATFLGVSILFWSQVIPSPPLHLRMGYLGRMGCLGVAIVQNVALAVLLGFAPMPLYAPYAHLVQVPGQFSALQDQQLGAGIMWTFGDLPFGIAMSILIQQWFASQPETAVAEVP